MAIVSDRRKLSEREITELERKKQLAAQRVSGRIPGFYSEVGGRLCFPPPPPPHNQIRYRKYLEKDGAWNSKLIQWKLSIVDTMGTW